jgi:putative membrane protein
MRTLLRNILIYTLIVYILVKIIPGFILIGGLTYYLLSGVCLSILMTFIKPILNVFGAPINILSFGLFSIFSTAILLFVLTHIISEIRIEPFSYPRLNYLGILLPQISFNDFFAYIYTSFVLSFVDSFIKWLLR